jgi:hypothetical protein
MKNVGALLAFLFTCQIGFSQETTIPNNGQKGKLYFYWGWNVSSYTTSDIHFTGNSYDFSLSDVQAQDRQNKFSIDKYLNPLNATIPQYNFRVGYFLRDNYNISFGFDHMKYVMNQNQVVKINGEIAGSGTSYDKSYTNEDLVLSTDFLQYEHTDGLNYLNIELRRFDTFHQKGNFTFNLTEGVGIGGMLPKTNATLFGGDRYDEFHWAGYGMSIMAGLNVTYKKFFIQTEWKGGFINMPKIRTTQFTSENASQHFFFSQFNIVFGGIFDLSKN